MSPVSVTAGILAAGHGRRLQGLQGVPKVMLRVRGEPLLGWSIRSLESAGFRDIICVVNSTASESVGQYLHRTRRSHVRVIVEDTRSALYSFRALAQAIASQHFVFVTVDALFRAGALSRFVARAFDKSTPQFDLALGLTSLVDDESPVRVEADDNWRVTKIGDSASNSRFVTAGVYIGARTILPSIDAAISHDVHTLRGYLQWLVDSRYVVYAWPLGDAIDVDTPRDVKSAEDFLASSGEETSIGGIADLARGSLLPR